MSEKSSPIYNLIRPMLIRDSQEDHRAATPLELLYDLVSVIAIASAAGGLHHAIADDHIFDGILTYGIVFFAIWWPWMNFTWFASSYDSDDVPYRIAILIQMAGALVLAAGVESVFTEFDFTMGLIGYIIMRLSLVSQWLRVARHNPEHRITAIRYVVGMTLCQLGWTILILTSPEAFMLPGIFILIACELFVPAYAERASDASWHRHHIIERYGLLTIIVLGESLLAISVAIASVASGSLINLELIATILGGLVIMFVCWWLYFDEKVYYLFETIRGTFVWGYSHVVIFGSLAAIGAGLAVLVDYFTDHAKIGPLAANAAVTIPTAIFLLFLWFIHERPKAQTAIEKLLLPTTAGLVLLTAFLPYGVLLTGILLSLCLTIKLRQQVALS